MQRSIQKNPFKLSTVICLTGSLFIVLRMIMGSQLFLLMFLGVVAAGIIIDKIENKIVYILYFIPWVYVAKFSFDQLSLVTLLSALYCVVCAIYILMHKTQLSIVYIITLVSIFMYSFFSLLISSSSSIVGILSFLLNFVVIYFAVLFVNHKKLIPSYILFHALGLTIAGGVNFLGNSIPAIEYYITSFTVYHTVNTSNTLYTRFTGLDMDPNYFSIQVLLAIACLCMIIFSNQLKLSTFQKNLAYTFISLLSLMGIMTLSKMFLISFGIFISICLVLLLKSNFKKGIYYIIGIGSVLGLTVYTFYDYFYQAYFFRFFSEGRNAGAITSGRSDIWMTYYNEITGNARLLFLGNGLSSDFLDDKLSHNMYLIAWYYLGVVGLILFISLFAVLYSQLKRNLNARSSFSLFNLSSIPLMITIIANFSLDSFIMNYFGVHIFLIILILVMDMKTSSEPSTAIDRNPIQL